jgi:hypothetical protein
MSFGTLHKIQCEIERQADEIRKARALIYQASWELEHVEEKENTKRLVREALEVLTKLAN